MVVQGSEFLHVWLCSVCVCVCVCNIYYIVVHSMWILFCTFSGDTITNGGGDWNPNNDTSYTTTANGQTDKT